MGKLKGNHTTWSHHETMIVNLRDWMSREANNLRSDLTKEVPSLAKAKETKEALEAFDAKVVEAFDLLRSVLDSAEKQAKKKESVTEEK